MANPTSDRALVRYSFTKAQPPSAEKVTIQTATGPVQVPKTAGIPKGGHTTEEFILEPPTNSIAEVEKRWRDANPPDSGKEWVDADLLAPSEPKPLAEPVLANETIPPKGTPTDSQIVRERAAGREDLPGTVTEDEDVKETKGKIRPASEKAEKAAPKPTPLTPFAPSRTAPPPVVPTPHK